MTDELVAGLRSLLDGRWGAVKDAARARLDSDDFAQPGAPLPMADYRARTTGQLLDLVDTPLGRLGFPVDYGGGGDVGGGVAALEIAAHADLSLFVKLGVQYGLFGGAITGLGSARHHAAYLPDLLAGRLLGCFAMTETGGGSDVANLGTTATYDAAADEIVVHTPTPASRKDYIGNAARDGRLAVVFGQLVVGGESRGVHAVLVPIRDEAGRPAPGVTIGDCGPKIGLGGVDNGRLSFDQVRVPSTSLLDRYGTITAAGAYESPIESDSGRFFTMLGALVRGRAGVGGAAGAATRNALTIAIRYALVRNQFQRPGGSRPVRLMEYAVHRRRLLIPLARSYALGCATNALIGMLDRVHADPAPEMLAVRELEGLAAVLKVANTAHATATIQTCREACGGAGYLWENRFGALKADSDVFTTFEGDNAVLLQLVAKGLLTRYRVAFESLDTRAMVVFGARQFAGAMVEHLIGGSLIQRLIAGAPGRDGDAALRDRGGQLALFEDREAHAVETLAQRMRNGDPDDPDAIWALVDAVQPHMLAAAWAHADRVLLDAFAAAVDAVDGPARPVLDSLVDLFALATVEDNAAWFQQHGRLSAGQVKDVTRRVDALCDQVAPHTAALVAGFGIPERFVAAPMLDGPGVDPAPRVGI